MMKFAVPALIAVMALPLSAQAQQQREQQVYPAYPNVVFVEPAAGQAMEEELQGQQMGTLRTYPGREVYGKRFGPIPRHPGDYKDAVDRGQWNGGGGYGQRAFDID